MDYEKVMDAVTDGWMAFNDVLVKSGFTDEQLSRFKKQLNYKDVYSAVDQCAVEAVR